MQVTQSSMKKNVSAALGFFIAPLFAATLLSSLELLSEKHLNLADAIGWIPIFYFFTLMASLVIGLPAYLLLRRYRVVTWWSSIIVGLFAGALMVFLFTPLKLIVIVVGACCGLLFWLVESRGSNELKVPGSN